MTMHHDFTNQVAMVTGASAGIGLAAAQAFAAAGASTVLIDVDKAAVHAAAEELAKAGHQVHAMVADVSDEEQVAAAVAEVVAVYGRLDAAFNNAGINMPPLTIADTDNATYERVIGVDLTGVWNSLKHEILQMRRQHSGVIVNNSSIAGLKSGPTGSAYVAAKHAVVALTKSAALQEGRQGIRVNVVCPGIIETPMVDRMVAAGELDKDAMAEGAAIPRLGRASEVADAVMWLCSTNSSYVTGEHFLSTADSPPAKVW
jgi:NAD(P)-dependent dehydrogenase (short-subunit alcohol dehydrogenase family)